MNSKQSRDNVRDRDVTKIYLKEVSQNPLLNHDDEKRLSAQIEQAKRDILLCVWDIPVTRDRLLKEIDLAVRHEPNIMLSVDSDQPVSAELHDKISQVHELITQHVHDQAADLKVQIAQIISELPIQLKFLDTLCEPVNGVIQQINACQGAYLRFAQSQGISRQEFLDNYVSDTPHAAWQTFSQTHAAQISMFTQELDRISSLVGVNHTQLQTKMQEIRKLQKLKDSAVETMLKSNLRLVVSVAKRYMSVSHTPLLDLVQEGNIGLLKAIEKYNWRLGFRFSTYATWWIKQCVLKALNEQHRIIRVPSHMTDLVKRVTRAREEYVKECGHEPSVEEIAAMLEMDTHAVARVWTVAQGTISLETPIGTEEDQNLSSVIEDPDGAKAFEHLAEQDTQRAVSDVLHELTAKEERVIRMRFGIGMDKEHTLEDIGHTFGVTRERVRQIEFKALAKLKDEQLAKRLQAAFE